VLNAWFGSGTRCRVCGSVQVPKGIATRSRSRGVAMIMPRFSRSNVAAVRQTAHRATWRFEAAWHGWPAVDHVLRWGIARASSAVRLTREPRGHVDRDHSPVESAGAPGHRGAVVVAPTPATPPASTRRPPPPLPVTTWPLPSFQFSCHPPEVPSENPADENAGARSARRARAFAAWRRPRSSAPIISRGLPTRTRRPAESGNCYPGSAL